MGPTVPEDPTRTNSSEPPPASARTKTLVWVVLLAVVGLGAWLLLRYSPRSAPAKTEAAARPDATAEQPDLPGARPLIRKTAEPNAAPWSGMHGPRGACLDGDGRVWVADFGTSRVFIFDPQGGFLGGWGGLGNSERRFAHPYGVAVNGQTVYVADTENSRVTAFSLAGDWRASSGGLYGPRGVAVAADGSVWVTDLGNRRLIHYDAALAHQESFGHSETGLDFKAPIGIVVGSNGLVYISDPDDHSLKVVDGKGSFKARWTIPTWGPNSEPYLANGPGDTLLATDPLSNAVIQLNRSGKETRRWTTDARNLPFSNPTGIAMNEKTQTVYVVNTASNAVTQIDLSKK